MKIHCFFGILFSLCIVPCWSQEVASIQREHHHEHHQNSNPALIENKGQWPQGVLFQSPMEGGKVWVQQHKFIYHLQDFSAMHKAHANPLLTIPEESLARQELIHLNFIGSQQIN